MTLTTRRVFRFAFVVALAFAVAYGFAMPYPYFAPIFAVVLSMNPGPPPAGKALIFIVVFINAIMGIGLFLSPYLSIYPVTTVLIITVGVFLASYLNVGKGKMAPAMLLTIALTMIPTIALLQYSLAADIVQSMVMGIIVTIVCQWLIYPFFPEDVTVAKAHPEKVASAEEAKWIATRATLIVMPVVLAAFINPILFKTLIIKTSLLSQTDSKLSTRKLAEHLILATCLGGALAIIMWFGLKLWPNLWLLFLWALLGSGFIAAKIFGAIASRYPVLFWQDVAVTLIILVGPAVMDSANGNDVYKGFLLRFGLFLIVAIYTTLAVSLLEAWRQNQQIKKSVVTTEV